MSNKGEGYDRRVMEAIKATEPRVEDTLVLVRAALCAYGNHKGCEFCTRFSCSITPCPIVHECTVLRLNAGVWDNLNGALSILVSMEIKLKQLRRTHGKVKRGNTPGVG